MKQYNFYKQYRMSINSSIPRIDLEIKEAKSDIEKLNINSELYIIANKRYQWLIQKRISNRDVSCNGIEGKQEALGSFETAKIMFDCESKDIGWEDIGYRSAQNRGNYDHKQPNNTKRINPIYEISKQAKALRKFTQ